MVKKTAVRDVLDALEDAMDAVQEAVDAATGLSGADSDGSDSSKAAVKASTEIRAGRLADAITTLEREFLPKWADRDACQAQYGLAVAA